MIHFVDFSQAKTISDEKSINTYIINISLDAKKESNYFKALASKYPDFEAKFDSTYSSRNNWHTGQVVKVKLDSGHTVFCILAKNLDQYAPYILDITNGIESILDIITKEHQDLSSCKVLTFLPTTDELKITDAIFIPSILDALSHPDINIWLVSNGDHDKYVKEILPSSVIHYKENSWMHDWMFTLDDLLFVNILATVQSMSPNYKLSKQNIARAYYICHQEKMYGKLEFYTTEFGPFFKLFTAKLFGLINHSIIINTHHFSKTDPPKFSGIFGPGLTYLKLLAYDKIYENRQKIRSIAKEIIKANIEAYKERAEASQSKPDSNFNRPKSTTPSSFNL